MYSDGVKLGRAIGEGVTPPPLANFKNFKIFIFSQKSSKLLIFTFFKKLLFFYFFNYFYEFLKILLKSFTICISSSLCSVADSCSQQPSYLSIYRQRTTYQTFVCCIANEPTASS